MKAKIGTNDPDIIGSLPAMRRAARRARQLARQTRTPLLVMRNGKIVNINPSARPADKREAKRRHNGAL
jgi:hypothetical protein